MNNNPIQDLTDRLKAATTSCHKEWKDMMLSKYREQYYNIHAKLDYAIRRVDEINARIDELNKYDSGAAVVDEISKLKNIRRPLNNVVNSAPAQYDTVDEYISLVEPLILPDMLMKCEDIAQTLQKKGLDITSTNVDEVRMDKDILRLIVSDAHEQSRLVSLSAIGFQGGKKKDSLYVMVTPYEKKEDNVRNVDISVQSRADNLLDSGKNRLGARLQMVLGFVKDEWNDMWMNAHESYYDMLSKKIPFARQRRDELEREISILRRLSGTRENIKSLKRLVSTFSRMLSTTVAAYPDKQSYINHITDSWDREFNDMLDKIAEKLLDEGLDTDSARISSVKFIDDRIMAVVKDDAGYTSDITMKFVQGSGVNVPPHVKVQHGEVVSKKQNLRNETKINELISRQGEQNSTVPDGFITKVKLIEYNGKMFIGCHIDGKRMKPVPINKDEWKKYIDRPGNDKTTLAAAHFTSEIRAALQQQEALENNSRTTGRKL